MQHTPIQLTAGWRSWDISYVVVDSGNRVEEKHEILAKKLTLCVY